MVVVVFIFGLAHPHFWVRKSSFLGWGHLHYLVRSSSSFFGKVIFIFRYVAQLCSNYIKECLCHLCLVRTQCRTLCVQFHFRFDTFYIFPDYSKSGGNIWSEQWCRLYFLVKLSSLFWVKSSSFCRWSCLHLWGEVVFIFGWGCLHFVGEIVFILWVKSSSYFWCSRLHFWVKLSSLLWVMLSSF